MNLHVFCMDFVACRVAPVRARLIAEGLPKGRRRAVLVPLRRRAEQDARELGLALIAIACPGRLTWSMPGPPEARAKGILERIAHP